ncbi:MAG: hypothetical protein JST66_01885 [Bacteroidetes bacterium]|nr:hypothetical protein [Bacteroidota bacterium]
MALTFGLGPQHTYSKGRPSVRLAPRGKPNAHLVMTGRRMGKLTDALLLAKIEELILYLIDLKDRVLILEEEDERLKSGIGK